MAGPAVRRFSRTLDSRPHVFLLLWALLPRTARTNARVARHRFLSDSRALLRGEEAGWSGGGREGTRRRREAAGERGQLTEEWRQRSRGRAPARPSAGRVRFPRRGRGLRERGEGGAGNPEPASREVPGERSQRRVSFSRTGRRAFDPTE